MQPAQEQTRSHHQSPPTLSILFAHCHLILLALPSSKKTNFISNSAALVSLDFPFLLLFCFPLCSLVLFLKLCLPLSS
ncbi:hypothetical protein PCANC_10619 [Puccinia coronata f. sp. avenae]|uniref:Uncharacterized protein n=1 Tax=Puccinia coronata f. sp. avenae TaxID=200324 RepID=A0A2N5VR86_9BASI|nr:hypothetical protein PCANC_10619 [Puccinia coronata f. sp. avenae]